MVMARGLWLTGVGAIILMLVLLATFGFLLGRAF